MNIFIMVSKLRKLHFEAMAKDDPGTRTVIELALGTLARISAIEKDLAGEERYLATALNFECDRMSEALADGRHHFPSATCRIDDAALKVFRLRANLRTLCEEFEAVVDHGLCAVLGRKAFDALDEPYTFEEAMAEALRVAVPAILDQIGAENPVPVGVHRGTANGRPCLVVEVDTRDGLRFWTMDLGPGNVPINLAAMTTSE